MLLRESRNVSDRLSLEFSNWLVRSRVYLVRVFDQLEVNIVFSPTHQCPQLLVRNRLHPSDLPEIQTNSFVGGLDHHPVTDEVFFAVHACDTNSVLSMVHHEASSVPGMRLLKWWCVYMSAILPTGLDPSLFLQAQDAFSELDTD